MPLVAVPARTSFRAVTEAVYLRQWGDLSRRPTRLFALPENVRGELSRLLEGGAGPAELLDRACAHLGPVACYLLTATGRTVARTPCAPAVPARRPGSVRGGVSLRVGAESSPYDAWHLYVPDADAAPPRVLHEIAEVFAQYRDGQARRVAAGRAAGQELIGLLSGTARRIRGRWRRPSARPGCPRAGRTGCWPPPRATPSRRRWGTWGTRPGTPWGTRRRSCTRTPARRAM